MVVMNLHYNWKHIRKYSDKIVTYCIYIIPIGFQLFAIAEFITIMNNRKTYSANWDRVFRPASHYSIFVVRQIRYETTFIAEDRAYDCNREPCDPPSHTTRQITRHCVFLVWDAISLKYYNMFKTLRRPATPSDV